MKIRVSNPARKNGILPRYRGAPIHLEKKPRSKIEKKISKYIAIRGFTNAREAYIKITTNDINKVICSTVVLILLV